MTPTAPTLCLETEESTEPPPSTLYLASQSHRLCLPPRPAPPSSQACTRTLAVLCTAKMSKSALASSACLEYQREAAGARMEATRARRVTGRRRATASKRTHMDVIATSGCLTTSVLRMLSREDMGRCSARTTKDVEYYARPITSTSSIWEAFRVNRIRVDYTERNSHSHQATPSITILFPETVIQFFRTTLLFHLNIPLVSRCLMCRSGSALLEGLAI